MDINEFTKLRNDYKNAIKSEGKKLFAQMFKDFMDANPEILEIYWNQYTPSFNDGDPCVFGLGDFAYHTAENEEAWEDSKGDCSIYWGGFPENINNIARDFEKKITDTFDDAIFEEIFGNDKEITVSRDENGEIVFEIEYYDCGH